MHSNNRLGLLASAVFLTMSLLVPAPFALAQSNNPVPIINDPLVPTTVAPGGSGFTLTVHGTGFVPGSVVNWNGSPRVTAYVSAAQLTATIPSSDIAAPSTASITVTSPGGGISNVAFLPMTVPNLAAAFAGPIFQGVGSPRFVWAGDLNKDGKIDLAVTDQYVGVVSIFLGNGDGTFQPPVDYPVGVAPDSVAAGDLNGDGITDLVVAGQNSDEVSVLLGNGDGTFQSPVSYAAGHGPQSVTLADFDGDGKLDIAVANYIGGYTSGYNISILLGDGDGTFQPALQYGSTDLPVTGLAVGDFNGDGKLEPSGACLLV
jgi:hypothetical protein